MTQTPTDPDPKNQTHAQDALAGMIDQPADGAPPPGAEPDALAQARAEAAELKDKLLRTLADMENLRRRTEKEVADSRSYGIAKFAQDMLGVADNLRRALESLSDAARSGAEAGVTALIEGVELTERELLKTLERHGVRPLDPTGQKFDPNLHQAMFEAPHPTIGKGLVVQVVQTGYTIGERVLRPALVGVSSGQPAAPSPSADPQG